ncbi:hypothetical protein QCA50_019754 [Cerrena zonata]|uniref:Uncharacterized protein n=1 Tax=Cerrena zonata TaxID=2478898 RepID=A0AAW0FI16_9APHY
MTEKRRQLAFTYNTSIIMFPPSGILITPRRYGPQHMMDILSMSNRLHHPTRTLCNHFRVRAELNACLM